MILEKEARLEIGKSVGMEALGMGDIQKMSCCFLLLVLWLLVVTICWDSPANEDSGKHLSVPALL